MAETSHEKIDPRRIKSFVSHLAAASNKIRQSEEARENLQKQIKKVKTYATGKKIRKDTANKEITKLEEAIQEVLHKEITLLRGQAENQRIFRDLNNKVHKLELELANTREEDTRLIIDLKNKLQELNEKLAQSNKHEEQIKLNTTEIKDDVHELATEEKSRAERIKDMEDKLKAGFKFNKDGILIIEQKLSIMSRKLKHLEAKYGPEAVSKIREKVDTLKEKSRQARQQVIASKPKPIMEPEHELEFEPHELPAPKPMPKQMPPPIKPAPKMPPPIKPAPKSGMKLPPPPPAPDKLELPKFDDTSGLEFSAKGSAPIEDLEVPRPPPMKKRGFFRKLFGFFSKKK